MLRRFGVLLSLVVMAGFYVGANRNPGKQMPGMKTYDSPVYTIYSDVPEDDAKEAVLRMTKMAFEYNERTKGLFTGHGVEEFFRQSLRLADGNHVLEDMEHIPTLIGILPTAIPEGLRRPVVGVQSQ